MTARYHTVPACLHDCSQGRGDGPTPHACRAPLVGFQLRAALPTQVPRVPGLNLSTHQAQVHATARRAELLALRIGIALCVAGVAFFALAPDAWVLALNV